MPSPTSPSSTPSSAPPSSTIPDRAAVSAGDGVSARDGVRPRVKICGLRSAENTLQAVRLGAELIGLNFHAPSPRSVSEEEAVELLRTVRAELGASSPLFVGVFVDHPVETATAIGERVGLDLLQFHGDYTPEEVRPVAERALVALRVKDRLDAEVLGDWLDVGAWGMVIDSRHPTLYGGSGESWDFSSLGRLDPAMAERLSSLRLLIAGGIRPGNARAAVRAANPWGIDVASGVESEPGTKDPELMAALFEEIRHG